jgi:hypothetical protein
VDRPRTLDAWLYLEGLPREKPEKRNSGGVEVPPYPKSNLKATFIIAHFVQIPARLEGWFKASFP